jgi:Flp pilus assembly pilin Flp
MQRCCARFWREDDGVLAFEWVLLVTLLTIGVIGGIAAARDAIIDELGDVAQSMVALDQSYTVAFPLVQQVHVAADNSASNSSFTDALIYTDCTRATTPRGQVPPTDVGPP